ncbi:ABC transporter substrate-binding protein [Chakrabartyella piscis]|uniref:ABC transporter substrate-binding protein n=1 Tax=Chakrabartyella piscis TaxID=2918914 RepID=UPI0029589457|nr:MqnA/MqnD/SBP family protein [Chakrabartyella piscis]
MKRNWMMITMVAMGLFMAGCGSNTAEVPVEETVVEAVVEEVEVSADPVDMSILALKGPTAMGMVSFMYGVDSGEITDNNYDFSIIAAVDEVAAMLVKGEADIAALPANMASVLYNNTEGAIQVLGVNTLGVLYLVENGDALESIADLEGKTIYASGKGATPEYALMHILAENNLADSVTIEWKSEHAECVAAVAATEGAIAMLPEPFVTTAKMQNPDMRVAIDLNDAWEEMQGDVEDKSALITGVLVANRGFVEENTEALEMFMDHYNDSVLYTKEDVMGAAELVGKYEIVTQQVAEIALPACNITWVTGDDLVDQLGGYLAVLMEQNPASVGGALPADDFYYIGE